MKNLIQPTIFILSCIIIISCSKDIKRDYNNEGRYTENNQSQNNGQKNADETLGGPPKEVVEREVMNIINKIPAEDYKYNASIFLNMDGVYKNLAVINTEIASRGSIETIDNLKQQVIQLKITGIMDKYSVGGGLPPSLISQGRGNFSVNKEFVFKMKNNNWLGYLNDNARDRGTLRFKKTLLR